MHDTGFRYREVDPTAPGAVAEVLRALVADPARNAQIVADICAALARGRNCLVLTRRVAHIDAARWSAVACLLLPCPRGDLDG